MDEIGNGQAILVLLRCESMHGRAEVAHASSEEHAHKEALLDLATGTEADGVRAKEGHSRVPICGTGVFRRYKISEINSKVYQRMIQSCIFDRENCSN